MLSRLFVGSALLRRCLIACAVTGAGVAGLAGCTSGSAGASRPVDGRAAPGVGPLTVVEVPSPHSPDYTAEQAAALVPQVLAASRAVDPDSPVVAAWKPPAVGFRVHITADDEIQAIDIFGIRCTGMAGVEAALLSCQSIPVGLGISALLTSETDGWDSPSKRQVLELLSSQAVQMFVVTSEAADARAA